jgi:hypothetical protein
MGADDVSTDDLWVAHRASVASIVWSVLAGTTMIVLGVQSSTVLVAVGAVGDVDGVGSVALVHHFAHGLRHAELDDRFERRAHRIVTVGLVIVGVATVAVSIVRLAVGTASDAGAPATIVAGVSAIVLALLAAVKVRVGRRIPSHALVADGQRVGDRRGRSGRRLRRSIGHDRARRALGRPGRGDGRRGGRDRARDPIVEHADRLNAALGPLPLVRKETGSGALGGSKS